MSDKPPFWTRDPYQIDCDKDRLDRAWITATLAKSYWSRNIPPDVVNAAIEGAICFGLYETTNSSEQQIGFARTITDGATFAWITDVVVAESQRGQGLGSWLITCLKDHPDLQGLRRWMLATRDAHGLYRKFGFEAADATRLMTIHQPGIYLDKLSDEP